MWEGTPNYHINGLQAAAGAAATVAGKRVGKMQKSAAAATAAAVASALTAAKRSLQWDQAAGSGNQASRQRGSHKTFFQFAKRKSFSYYSCSQLQNHHYRHQATL